jgi:phenylpyruvate tautomerase PptA (4-oxalocrotonate tautomerase family)
MPRYELTTDEELSAAQKAALAREITDVHVKVTGAPPSIVHVVFLTTGPGNAFVAGEARPGTYLQGSIRAGRDHETTTTLLTELTAAVSRITGTSSSDVVVALRETPGRLVMEGGRIMPDPGEEDDLLRRP